MPKIVTEIATEAKMAGIVTPSSPFDASLSFDDGDVAIDGHVGQPLNPAAGCRPLDLDPVHFLGGSDT